MMLDPHFFNRDAQLVAKDLLGKVIYSRYEMIPTAFQDTTRRLRNRAAQCTKKYMSSEASRQQSRSLKGEGYTWLSAMIVETEAYYLEDKGSHASLGWTKKRHALFMPPGTIYMYYARGGDSLNVSCRGDGNAVLIKAAIPYGDDPLMLATMHQLNPVKNSLRKREDHRLCAGQTLLCKALHLKVPVWDQGAFDKNSLYITDVGYTPTTIWQTTRLGIPTGRDEHLPYRFIDANYAHASSSGKKL